MSSQAKSHMIAAGGTALFLLLLFLILWFVYVGVPQQVEEEGIMVSFGQTDEGGGNADEPATPMESVSQAPAPQPAQASDNDYMTQEDEESLRLAQQREQERQRKAAEEQERIRQRKEAEARAEAERIAKEQAIAEQKAKEQQAIDKANQLGSLFGKTSSTGGSGTSSGNTVQGNPVGKGSSGGNSWSLNGRSLKSKLATPTASGVQEGKIVVAIRVNASGKVVSATLGAGTTISEKATQQATLEAAYKAVFSAGSGDVVGTITYVFRNR